MSIKNSSDMRQFLIEQMTSTAEGKIEAGQAKAICNFAQQIYNTSQLEMKFAALKAKNGGKELEPVEWS